MTKPITYICILVFSCIAMGTQAAHAVCIDPTSLDSGYQTPLDEEIMSSQAIAIGEVIESHHVEKDKNDTGKISAYIYNIKVLKLIKGKLPKTFMLRDKNDSDKYSMKAGEHHLLFLKPEGKYYKVDSCGNSVVLPQGNEVLKEVESLINKSKNEP